MRLADLGASLSWRRLGVLLRQLPIEARTIKLVGGAHLAWDSQTHLLAMIVDALHAANWQRGGGKTPRPQPIPRPGETAEPVKDSRRFGTAVPLPEARRILDEWSN